jgi:hypothetical protein
MNTNSLESPPESSQLSPLVSEILALHGEILIAAHNSLTKAIRIGELLVGIKADLAHGEWLPWLKANMPFAERSARNYMRCHAERDRLKSANVADLGEAYRLLAPPQADTPPAKDEIPSPEGLIHASQAVLDAVAAASQKDYNEFQKLITGPDTEVMTVEQRLGHIRALQAFEWKIVKWKNFWNQVAYLRRAAL